jgi:hypothetical protein
LIFKQVAKTWTKKAGAIGVDDLVITVKGARTNVLVDTTLATSGIITVEQAGSLIVRRRMRSLDDSDGDGDGDGGNVGGAPAGDVAGPQYLLAIRDKDGNVQKYVAFPLFFFLALAFDSICL